MPDELDLARGWLLKAESDLHTARLMVESDGPYDTACFHAQQAAEKYLKGLLALHQQAFPRTHNVEELQHLGETLPA
jgi:HEPN domain-containing protein